MVNLAGDHGSDASPRGTGSTQAPSLLAADLRYAFGVLRYRRGLILRSIGLALLLALAYIWITPPLYTAKAQVLIDPRKREIVNKEIVPSGLGTSSLGADTFLLDSQVEVMMSEGLRRALIADQHLDQDEEFGGSSGNAAVRGLKYIVQLLLSGPQAVGVPAQSPVDRALKKLEKRLQINREGNTYVIDVRMISEDPKKSADIANAFTRLYIEQGIAGSRTRVEEAETLISGRLEELRQAAVDGQKEVETFRAKHGLLAAERSTLVEQELRDLNQQLTVSATNTSRTLARWKEVGKLKSMPFEQALAAGSIQSTLLANLQDRYAAIVAQEASLLTSLKPRHPNVIAIRDSKAALRREISAELSRLVSRTKVDYDVAVANETAIRNRLNEAKKVTVATNQAAITLGELEQQSRATQAIYQEFLARSKDAREQITLPSDSVRVVSPGFAPARPSWPLVPLLLGFAVFAGLIIGLALAALLEIFRDSYPVRATRALLAPSPRSSV